MSSGTSISLLDRGIMLVIPCFFIVIDKSKGYRPKIERCLEKI